MVAEACKEHRLQSVALLGTTFAMSRSFFSDRIASHGLEVRVPDAGHHETINRIIYEELVHGKVLDASRRTMVGLVDELWDAGAGGVILGCTELELLIHQADVELPVFPCTTLHVEAALTAPCLDSPSRKAPLDRARQVLFVTDYRERSRSRSARRRSSGVRWCSGTLARVPPRSKT